MRDVLPRLGRLGVLRLVVLCCCVTGLALAQSPDPRVEWRTADSANFRIHYRASQRTQAEAVARAAERAYTRVVEALQWRLRGRTEIVVISETDLANGYATPLPYSLLGVMLPPPDDGELLENSAWLDLLLVHELTHAVHLDQVRALPAQAQQIFGNVPYFIPNLFNPSWALEGLAVQVESERLSPAGGPGQPGDGLGPVDGAWSGWGRLHSPGYEAWLRAERARGFIGLSELNADGRALPLSKQYLYGAYFYDFLARRYGADAPRHWVTRYSGNPPLWPRLHSNPQAITGKTLDVLWEEFLADLSARVDVRALAIQRQPEAVGAVLAAPLFRIPSVAMQADGSLLAVLDDGLLKPRLLRFAADGHHSELAEVQAMARVTAAPDGRVLVAQPDLCDAWTLAYDLYAVHEGGLKRLTHCARLRRAVYAGQGAQAGIVALKQEAGATRLVWLDAQGGHERVIYTPPGGVDLSDLAADQDLVSVVAHQGADDVQRRGAHPGPDWRIVQFDLARPQDPPRTVLRRDRPIHGLSQDREGLTMVLAEDGVPNVWRLKGASLQRLSHAYTGVTAQSGLAADGSFGLVTIVPGGYALSRMSGDTFAPARVDLPVEPQAVPQRVPSPIPEPQEPRETQAPLGLDQPYAAWRSMVPRWWWPALWSDHGLFTVGVQTSGADALGWHQYAALLAAETTQNEAVGSLEYLYRGQHHLSLSRSVDARAWTGQRNDPETTAYKRDTQGQWLSTALWPRLDQRFTLGLGAALERSEWVDVASESTRRLEDTRLAAALVDYDSRGANWNSEGTNRGLNARLLYESYAPFKGEDGDDLPPDQDYDGAVLRADLRGFVPLGRTVLGLRYTEARAQGRTEAFQLGGATDEHLQLGTQLGNRTLALRGYSGDEPELQGVNARVASLEWRTPLADIDRHFMVPPVGINRLSASVFYDVGGAWGRDEDAPSRYWRGVGVELLGEVKLLYVMGLQMRLGIAKGLDGPQETHGYLTVGRAF
ncbi:hypothetical protein [Hylemonella gracilis]|uniref:Bacterial surface antigen (D15) domain-containing protein n=1 Tax=Hylemonella gracilis ATCC 19624 TaxID=887062 RepID=F3KT34_9BURK|nr:hypothetical protein [Hylemonella gracilis]EGI77030.1 hypothetical protein HGR_08074 [Hylemonella gracilis ATCC 19624]